MGRLATSPLLYGGSQSFTAGYKMRSGPQVGALVTCPMPYGGSPTLHTGGQNEKRPTSGCIGYLTPAVWGVPNAS